MINEDNDTYDLTELENDEVIRRLLNVTMDSNTEFKTQHYPVLVRLQKLYNEGKQ